MEAVIPGLFSFDWHDCQGGLKYFSLFALIDMIHQASVPAKLK